MSFSASLIYSFIKANPACTYAEIKQASGFNGLQTHLVLDELLERGVVDSGLLESTIVYFAN